MHSTILTYIKGLQLHSLLETRRGLPGPAGDRQLHRDRQQHRLHLRPEVADQDRGQLQVRPTVPTRQLELRVQHLRPGQREHDLRWEQQNRDMSERDRGEKKL